MSSPEPDFDDQPDSGAGTTPMSAVRRLGAVSREYEKQADAYRDVAIDAAAAEAEHKAKRAQAILRFKAERERMSHAEAETRAEADETVAALYRERLITAAVADSHRAKLYQLREQVRFGVSAAVTEREADRIHASGWSGAS